MINRLKELRAAKRVTQFDLRLSTGIHQSKISLIENGLIEPSEEEMRKISQALEIKPGKIWGNKKEGAGVDPREGTDPVTSLNSGRGLPR